MPKKLYPTDVLTQAIDIQEAWSRIDEQLTFGNLNVGALVADITQIRSLEHSLSSLEIQLTELRNTRDAVCQSTWDKVKRVRAGVKANFGDDSSQYEMVGGTRLSDRKPIRKSPLPVEQA
jgi:hypothetical protein